MGGRHWYEAEALMVDLTDRRHEMEDVSEEEVERRMRDRYPDAVAIWCTRRRERGRGEDLLRGRNARGEHEEDSGP